MNNMNIECIDKLSLLFGEWDFLRLGLVGGRMAGKSEAVASAFVVKSLQGNESYKIGCFREVQKAIRDSVKSLIERKIELYNLNEFFEIKQKSILCKRNGVEFIFNGLLEHTLDSIKSIDNLRYIWVEEAQSITKNSISTLEPTFIRYDNASAIFTWNPKYENSPIHQHLIVNPPDRTKLIEISYKDNPFLNKSALAEIEDMKKRDYQEYLHVYGGMFRQQSENAIWKKDVIDQHRIKSMPEETHIKKCVIGVDPAKRSRKGENDEWGIVCCVLQDDEKAVVLEDKSGNFTPEKASQVICNLYRKHNAGWVIVEDNVGGDMVRDVVRMADNSVNVHLVTAISSKRHRANPIAYRYAKGQVLHFGVLSQLEYQMCAWTEDEKFSPDRLDAMVHALRFLFNIASKKIEAFSF